MKIRCLIADDEPLAIQLISGYVARISHLELVGSCKRATDIPAFLGQVDLLFLDIRMPGFSGLELLHSLKVKPLVIMITAFSEHALEGFELDVVDYLVKPVTFERFFQAVTKATRQYELEQRTTQNGMAPADPPPAPDLPSRDYFFIKSGYKSVRINFDEILYVEGLKEYVSIYTSGNRKFVKLTSLKELERILPRERFLRIHKSYIVSVNQVTAAYGNVVELNQVSLPIGRIYKEEVMKVFS